MEFLCPLESSPPLERVRREFRRKVKAWDRDRELHRDLEASRLFLQSDVLRDSVSTLR
jgi:histidine ammonia-lyase